MYSFYTFYTVTDIIAVFIYLLVALFLCRKLSTHKLTFFFLSVLHLAMTFFYYYNGAISTDTSDCAIYFIFNRRFIRLVLIVPNNLGYPCSFKKIKVDLFCLFTSATLLDLCYWQRFHHFLFDMPCSLYLAL